MVFLGLESGNNRILKILKGRSSSVEKNQRALDLLKKNGIPAYSLFIAGYFDESVEEIGDTFAFIQKNLDEGKLADTMVTLLLPFPGTPIWATALEKGLVSYDMDWNRFNYSAPASYPEFGSFENWVKRRKQVNATYLCQTIPEDQMYDLFVPHLEYYYRRKENMNFNSFFSAQLETQWEQSGWQRGVLYGAGGFSDQVFRHLPDFIRKGLVGVVDGNSIKHGGSFKGMVILPPESLVSMNPDVVILGTAVSMFQTEIKHNINRIFSGRGTPAVFCCLNPY